MTLSRCPWSLSYSPHSLRYHDEEWGVPCYDDQKLFEMLLLEGAQAGLNWSTILNRRENYRQAFDQFNVEKVAQYDQRDQQRLLADKGIIRNRLKIASAITNANAFLNLQARYGSFSQYLWQVTAGRSIINHFETPEQVPVTTPLSETLSHAFKKAGFSFVGPTICYAYMQAIGMVNNHLTSCFRHHALSKHLNSGPFLPPTKHEFLRFSITY